MNTSTVRIPGTDTLPFYKYLRGGNTLFSNLMDILHGRTNLGIFKSY